MFDVELYHPTQASLGVLGNWERALSWRDLTTLDGWVGDLGYIKPSPIKGS